MLTRELISKVRKIEIKTRKMVDELTAGAYHSVFKGRGIEFSEVREYTPDDDVRDIDWNVTARTGIPYIKKYSEERELTVILALDASASLEFGSDALSKHEKAVETAALLAFSAIRNNDKVGLLIFTDRTELWLAPRSGRKHVLRLIRDLLAFEPKSPRTGIAGAMNSLAENLKKRAVVFCISDFLDDASFDTPMKILSSKHDLIAVRVLDRTERELPDISGISFEDAESGAEILLDSNESVLKKAYAEHFSEQLAGQDRSFARAKVDLIDVGCSDDAVRPLMNFFRKRKLRKG